MPTPEQYESEDDFVERCMLDDIMLQDFANPRQRLAVCIQQYRDRENEST
jgi:hypothetical protein